jgi:hypothetical protein
VTKPARRLTILVTFLARICLKFREGTAREGLECRLLIGHAEMLTWTELAAYLSVVAALCGGGAAVCWAVLWRE